jgi:hypothetical protein
LKNGTVQNTHCSFNVATEFQLCLATYFAETLNAILKGIQTFNVQKFNGRDEAVTALHTIFNGRDEAVTALHTIFKKNKIIMCRLLGKSGSLAFKN